MTKIKVVELFAGVGGFRLGLEGWMGMSASSGYKKKLNSKYQVVWSNQYEPASKVQHASEIYISKWGKKGHLNQDISLVNTVDIPDHDLLVGGFPCQDYSVARVLSHSKGMTGKKGVLWWQIHRILKEKGRKKPKFLLLENVDRLLNSPASQRGKDFAIMLASLNSLGYYVEWKVVNAADYGMPQKRRRIFILGYLSNTTQAKAMKKDNTAWLTKQGTLSKAFKCDINIDSILQGSISGPLHDISSGFNKKNNSRPFLKSGLCINRKYITADYVPVYSGPKIRLGDKSILLEPSKVRKEYYLSNESIDKWKYVKGSKNEFRKRRDGEVFKYNEGSLAFPDNLDSASRTIITSEGGKSPSRTKHVIRDSKGLRRLTPIELERLNMFPDNFTEGMSDGRRAFFMGNALVVGVIERIGKELAK